MQQEYQLGSRLRKIYIDQYHLLPNSYAAGTLLVQSTYFDRTIMSAQSLLAGLYPLGTGPRLPHSQLPALPQAQQVIPIHVIPENQASMFIPELNEKSALLTKQYAHQTPEWIHKTQAVQSNFPAWSKSLGITITQLDQLQALANTLYIRQLYQIPLPQGLSQKDAEKIMATGEWAVGTSFKDPRIDEPTGGVLLERLSNDFIRASSSAEDLKNQPDPKKSGYLEDQQSGLKYLLFSAHDSTLLTLMGVMGAPLKGTPPYASDLHFELFDNGSNEPKGSKNSDNSKSSKAESRYEIHVTFNGKPVIIPGCHESNVCSLSEFSELVQPKNQ
jgi:hypothetical protein